MKYFSTMCCIVFVFACIFAVQTTMQQKVDSFKMYYIFCNEIEFQASIKLENNFRNRKQNFKH